MMLSIYIQVSITKLNCIFLCIFLAAPVFKESISEYEFEVGGDIQLPCSYEAFPLATDVKWMKDSNTITNCVLTDSSVVQAASMDSTRCQSVISVLNPYLVISNAQNSDSGIYKCCVTNTISEQCGNDIIVGCKYDIFIVTYRKQQCNCYFMDNYDDSNKKCQDKKY